MAYETIIEKMETGKCLLCHDAPCTKACPNELPVSDMLFSIRFEHEAGAAKYLNEHNPCISCSSKACKEACNAGKIKEAVDIPFLFKHISEQHKDSGKPLEKKIGKPDLSVQFCNVTCENPFFLSSSIVGSNYEMIAKAFDMGWAGVAFKTIGTFVPKEVSPRFDVLEKENNPLIGLKNIEQISDHTLEENIDYIKRLKKNYPTKIIIASIMGQTKEEWTYLARKMEEAGADMIECNFSCPHMSGEGLGSDVGTNPELVAAYTKATREGTTLPILAKMTPNITNMEIPAMAAVEAGADAIAAINTIKSVMNVNIKSFASGPDVLGRSAVGGYSGKAVKPIALRFIHDMKSNETLKQIPISGMGGIETWKDAMEFLALGCETLQITTAIMQYGYRIINDLIDGLSDYLKEEGHKSVSDIIGKANDKIIAASDLERTSIEYPKFDRKLCVSCGRCYISCYDGGHQAITMNEKGQPVMNGKKCVGCQLCKLVCPAHAISKGTRVYPKEMISD